LMPRLLTVKGCEFNCSSLSKLLTSFCDLVSCCWLSFENMSKKQNGLRVARGGIGRGAMKRAGGKMRNQSAERGGRGQNRGRGHGRGRGGFDNQANRDEFRFGRGVDKQLFGKKNKMDMVDESKNRGAFHSPGGRGISLHRGKPRGNLSTSLKKKVHFADPIEEQAKDSSQSENESDMDEFVLKDDLEDEEMFEEGNSEEDIEESENKDSEDDEDDEEEEDDDDEDKDEADDDDLLFDSDEMDIDEDEDDEDDEDDILDSSDSDEEEIYVKKLGSFGEKVVSATGKKVGKKAAEVAIKSSPKHEISKPEVQEKNSKQESPKNKIKNKNSNCLSDFLLLYFFCLVDLGSITKISVKKEGKTEKANLLEEGELEAEIDVVRNLKEVVRKEKTKNDMKNKKVKSAIEHEESKKEMKNKKVKNEMKNEKSKNEMKIEKAMKEEVESEKMKLEASPAKKAKLSAGVQAEKKIIEIEQRRRLKRNKCRLFLKDLPLESSIADVKALSKDIIHVFKPTEKSRFCFLIFANEKVCEKNYEKLKNITMNGTKLTVDFMGEKGKNFKPTTASEISSLINPTELYVGDVSSKEEVLQAFPSAGSIQMHDMYAFVKFATAEAAREAFNCADNVKLSRPIYVFYTRPKEVRNKTRHNKAKKVIKKKNFNNATGNKVASKKLSQRNANAEGRKRKYEEEEDDDESLEDIGLKIFEGDDEELKVDE
ncbi:Replicase polyprotein 1a, partial [Trichinella zimbabwensis]